MLGGIEAGPHILAPLKLTMGFGLLVSHGAVSRCGGSGGESGRSGKSSSSRFYVGLVISWLNEP